MSHITRFPPLAAAVALILSPAADAQNRQASLTALGEIVVTASKRVESLQDVPIAVTAYSGDLVRSLAISDIEGLAVQTPSFAFSKAGGEAQIYIRGVGTNIFGVGADPSVAVNLDGVYLGRTNMGLTQFLDIDRVEILRGPQGTLYGRNATGGAINLISAMPGAEFGGYATAGFGEFDRIELEGAFGGPMDKTLGVSTWLAVRGQQLRQAFSTPPPGRTGRQPTCTLIEESSGAPASSFKATLSSASCSEFSNGSTSIIQPQTVACSPTIRQATRSTSCTSGSITRERNDLPTWATPNCASA